MATLAIKTPSSASLVLIFQLLVLKPRPNIYATAFNSICLVFSMKLEYLVFNFHFFLVDIFKCPHGHDHPSAERLLFTAKS